MSTIDKKSFLKKLADVIVSIIKKYATQKALEIFLQSAGGAGIKVWLIKLAVKILVKEAAEPGARAGVIELKYAWDDVSGEFKWKAVKRASNGQEYDDAVDNIFGGGVRVLPANNGTDSMR